MKTDEPSAGLASHARAEPAIDPVSEFIVETSRGCRGRRVRPCRSAPWTARLRPGCWARTGRKAPAPGPPGSSSRTAGGDGSWSTGDGTRAWTSGTFEASLTGLYPWSRRALNDRVEARGHGRLRQGRAHGYAEAPGDHSAVLDARWMSVRVAPNRSARIQIRERCQNERNVLARRIWEVESDEFGVRYL